MTLAVANSGRSDLLTSLPAKVDFAVSATAEAVSTTAEPPVAAAASNPVVRTVITLVASVA